MPLIIGIIIIILFNFLNFNKFQSKHSFFHHQIFKIFKIFTHNNLNEIISWSDLFVFWRCYKKVRIKVKNYINYIQFLLI
jgi:hypothetical protein